MSKPKITNIASSGSQTETISRTSTAVVPYTVGYGKPPLASRFQPRQSGNPKGRVRGSKNKIANLGLNRLKSIILSEAYRHVDLRENERNVTVPMAQAIMRSIAVNAVRGNVRAQRQFVELVESVERENFAAVLALNSGRLDYKYDWERELERRRKNGIVLPDPFPHPDTYVLDRSTGLVTVYGPRNRDEIPLFLDGLPERIKELEDATQLVRDIPLEEHEPEERARFLKVILECDRTLKIMRAIARYGEDGGEVS